MSSSPVDPQTPTPPPLPPAATTRRRGLPKNPWLAVVFSFVFPGLGQVYNGELAKAFVFFSAFVGSIRLVAQGNPFPFAFFIPFAFLFGAHRRLEGRHRDQRPLPRRRPVDRGEVTESPAWGITLVGLGLVFLAHNLGWLDLDKLARFWPLLLIGAGAFFIYGSIRKRKAEESVDGGSRL